MIKMKSADSLQGRIVVLTGATGHLGLSLADALGAVGATVVLVSRSKSNLSAQEEALRRKGISATAFPMDITKQRERRDLLEAIRARFGRVDGIVNNAYCAPTGTGAAAFLEAYDIAVASVADLISGALPLLKHAAADTPGGASIVNIASMYGIVSPDLTIYSDKTPPNPPFYGPAKAGLIQLTRYLACELGPLNIRVNAVSPGPFPAPSVLANDPEFARRLSAKTPLRRIGQPDELGGPVLFLLSSASSYVTGANLCVDGGWTAW